MPRYSRARLRLEVFNAFKSRLVNLRVEPDRISLSNIPQQEYGSTLTSWRLDYDETIKIIQRSDPKYKDIKGNAKERNDGLAKKLSVTVNSIAERLFELIEGAG